VERPQLALLRLKENRDTTRCDRVHDALACWVIACRLEREDGVLVSSECLTKHGVAQRVICVGEVVTALKGNHTAACRTETATAAAASATTAAAAATTATAANAIAANATAANATATNATAANATAANATAANASLWWFITSCFALF